MLPQQNQPNPLAGLMALLGGQGPATPNAPTQAAGPQTGAPAPQQPAPTPMPMQQPAPQQQSPMNPIIQSLMGQSQAAMQNPMGQPVPQGGGGIDAAAHPLIAGLIKALASAASGYGWTAMQPDERLARTQMNQQKGQALSQLALAGTEYEGNLGIKQQNADTAGQRADTAQQRADTLQSHYDFMEQIAQEKNDIQRDKNDVEQAYKEGRLDQIDKMIQQRVDQFTTRMAQNKDLALKSLAVRSNANDIRQNYVDMLGKLRSAALQQGNAKIAAGAAETLGKLQTTNWLQSALGMAGPETVSGAVSGLGAPQALPPNPVVQPSTSTTPPSPKAKAKGATGGKSWNPVKGVYE